MNHFSVCHTPSVPVPGLISLEPTEDRALGLAVTHSSCAQRTGSSGADVNFKIMSLNMTKAFYNAVATALTSVSYKSARGGNAK